MSELAAADGPFQTVAIDGLHYILVMALCVESEGTFAAASAQTVHRTLSDRLGPPTDSVVASRYTSARWSSFGERCMRNQKNSARRRKRVDWSAADVKVLKGYAGKRSAKQIGKVLKRSESAVRFKAHTLKLSLATH